MSPQTDDPLNKGRHSRKAINLPGPQNLPDTGDVQSQFVTPHPEDKDLSLPLLPEGFFLHRSLIFALHG